MDIAQLRNFALQVHYYLLGKLLVTNSKYTTVTKKYSDFKLMQIVTNANPQKWCQIFSEVLPNS